MLHDTSEALRLPQYNNDGGLKSVAPATKTARIFDTLWNILECHKVMPRETKLGDVWNTQKWALLQHSPEARPYGPHAKGCGSLRTVAQRLANIASIPKPARFHLGKIAFATLAGRLHHDAFSKKRHWFQPSFPSSAFLWSAAVVANLEPVALLCCIAGHPGQQRMPFRKLDVELLLQHHCDGSHPPFYLSNCLLGFSICFWISFWWLPMNCPDQPFWLSGCGSFQCDQGPLAIALQDHLPVSKDVQELCQELRRCQVGHTFLPQGCWHHHSSAAILSNKIWLGTILLAHVVVIQAGNMDMNRYTHTCIYWIMIPLDIRLQLWNRIHWPGMLDSNFYSIWMFWHCNIFDSMRWNSLLCLCAGLGDAINLTDKFTPIESQ